MKSPVKKRKVVIDSGKHPIISVKDVRNILQRALHLSRTSGSIKITYPFQHGLQIDIEYTNQKSLFQFAMVYGVLMNEVNTNALLDNKKFNECKYFHCANCLKVGKENQNKLIKNFCNECAKDYTKIHEEEVRVRTDKLKVEVKEFEETIIIPEQTKPKVKKQSPVKLKFKK